jgi:hypothetical protein
MKKQIATNNGSILKFSIQNDDLVFNAFYPFPTLKPTLKGKHWIGTTIWQHEYKRGD